MTFVYVCLFVLVGLLILLGYSIFTQRCELKSLQSDVDYYKTTYGRHQGATAIGAYDLRTLDGGKNWYAVKAKGGEVVILGEAEKVYPGLLASIEGLAALIDYVDKNGPIGSRPITESDLKVLSGAGFTVTKK